jgi:hypothetical protein
MRHDVIEKQGSSDLAVEYELWKLEAYRSRKKIWLGRFCDITFI